MCLTPLATAIGASVSVDSVTNGITLLWIAFCAHLTFNSAKTQISNRDVVWLILLAALLGLVRQNASPLLLCVLCIPAAKWRGLSRNLFFSTICAIFTLTFFVCWYTKVKDLPMPYEVPEALPSEQLHYIITNPLDYAKIFFDAHSSYFPIHMALQYVGLKLVWNPVASRGIAGMSGRYYIASAPALFFAMSGWFQLPSKKWITNDAALIVSIIIVITSTFVTFSGIFTRYYW